MVTVYESDYKIANDRLSSVKHHFKDFYNITIKVNSYYEDHIMISVPTDNLVFCRSWCPVLIYTGYINCRDDKYLEACKKVAEEFDIDSIFKK